MSGKTSSLKDIDLPAQGGRAVLLLHGLMGNPLEMNYLARQLHRAGFAIRAPYLRGYGFGCGEGAKPWTSWHAQACDHFDALKAAYGSVSVCGLCIGAVLALNLAVERGRDVAALSLLATTLAFDGWSIPWYRFLAPLGYYTPLRYFYSYREREPYGLKNLAMRRWIAREMAEKTTSAAGAARLPLASVHQACRLIRQVRRTIGSVSVPTLVMHAREDDVASPKSARYVIERIATRDVRLVMLENSYHMLTMDNEKELVARETSRFFAASRASLPRALHGPAHAAPVQ